MDASIISIIPVLIAIVLAFYTKDAIFPLLTACVIGVLIAGKGILGIPDAFLRTLANDGTTWIIMIEVLVGILVAFFQKSGATGGFSETLKKKEMNRKQVQVTAWFLGIVAFFSDCFSALLVGTVMRDITDKAKISREKLAYISDSAASPVCTIVPFTSWAVYLAGLTIGLGDIVTRADASKIFLKSVMFNFYGVLAFFMVLFIALGIIPDFGPMKKAEKRAMEQGLVVAKDAVPLLGNELDSIKPPAGKSPNIYLNFGLPVLIIIGMGIGSFAILGSAMVLEAFMLAIVVQAVLLKIQGIANLKDIVDTAIKGIKAIIPALLITVLAYALNTISKDLGTGQFIVSIAEGWLTPSLLLLFTFVMGGVISFLTGTAWGTYAILAPIALPLAFNFTGGVSTILIPATLAAITGGGLFGDHCSPVSDTTILSSLGSGSDHIAHATTQLPYALTVGSISCVIYLIVGILV